jgi:hypothetical protein
MPRSWIKDPDDTLNYGVDWVRELRGDTIETSTWIVAAGITKVSDSKTATTTTIIVSGGTAGETYTLVNRIVTAAGLSEDCSLIIKVSHK